MKAWYFLLILGDGGGATVVGPFQGRKAASDFRTIVLERRLADAIFISDIWEGPA